MWDFIINHYDKIISAVIAIISAIVGAIVAIRSGKLAKAKEFMEFAIKEAEVRTGITGADKQEIVLSKIREFCVGKLHIKFNETLWKGLIDNCVALMNANARLTKEVEK